MVGGLLERLTGRFVFVTGKGGVGKTTTAGAIALALADAGERTHLLSTDPAHSVGDLFGVSLSGEPISSPCSPDLTLEELDAGARAEQWLADVRPAVAELVDRGTYLDESAGFELLERAVPGMDEVMGGLRFVELAAAASVDRVVVDTPPTGHALRLLDSADVLDGWVAALGAMAAKAAAVSAGLTGTSRPLAGEQVTRALEEAAERLQTEVLDRADFVIVTRDDPVVRAETERLARALVDRGLVVRATIRIGDAPDESARSSPSATAFTVALREPPVGCAGLREWGAEPAGTSDAVPPARPARPRQLGPEQSTPLHATLLSSREVVLFAGKGGVGKSTCAAAFAVAVSEDRPVTLLGLDPAGSLADVLGMPVGTDGTRVSPTLSARELGADERLARFREEYRNEVADVLGRLGVTRHAHLDRSVLDAILGMVPPGVDEIFALEALAEEADRGAVLVLDTAPTGHFLRLLAMPDQALEWVRGLMRVVLEYRSVLGLTDFAEDLLALSTRLKALIARLADPERTGIVVVTVAGALPAAETGRLLASLDEGRHGAVAVLHNRWRGGQAGTGGGGGGPVTITAPLLSPPPVGEDALREFGRGWAAA